MVLFDRVVFDLQIHASIAMDSKTSTRRWNRWRIRLLHGLANDHRFSLTDTDIFSISLQK
jgi:hypothetical protein